MDSWFNRFKKITSVFGRKPLSASALASSFETGFMLTAREVEDGRRVNSCSILSLLPNVTEFVVEGMRALGREAIGVPQWRDLP